MRVTFDNILAFLVVLTMALLVSLNPVRAAEPDRAAEAASVEQAAAEAQPAKPDDDAALNIVIMQEHMIVPNPYKNPEPRLISDAWSQRA